MYCPYCGKHLRSSRYSIAKPVPTNPPTKIKVIKKLRKYYVSPYCKRCGWSSKNIYPLVFSTFRTDSIGDIILDSNEKDILFSSDTFESKKTNKLVSNIDFNDSFI